MAGGEALPQLTIATADWPDYALLDTGEGARLERFGPVILQRVEPKAWWPRAQPEAWREAQARIGEDNRWRYLDKRCPRSWPLQWGKVKGEARLTDMSKHLGVFPEQAPHWEWLTRLIAQRPGAKVLNLFGYTGWATLVAAAAGAQVTHVDASKPALSWARENQARSGLEGAPIRWLLDDAFKFVAREVRRGNHYDIILLDPPSFGRGPKGELWKVEAQIVPLMRHLRALAGKRPLGLGLTMYNLEASALMLANLVRSTWPTGQLEVGELALRPQHGLNLLPLSLFARWNA